MNNQIGAAVRSGSGNGRKAMRRAVMILVMAASPLFSCRFFLPYGDIDMAIKARMEALSINGLAACVIKGDEILWSGNYGYEDVAGGRRIDEGSIFMSASVSKIIVSLAVMQLYDAGLLELDHDINDYLPFRVRHPRYPEAKITPRMLLLHSSSIIDNEKFVKYAEPHPLSDPFTPEKLKKIVEAYLVSGGSRYDAKHNFGDWKPGDAYSYSDVGVSLLVVMLENITGESFPVYTKERIFDPLGMTGTWNPNGLDPHHVVTHYGPDGEAIAFHRCDYYPAGNFYSTVADFSRLVSVFANGGSYQGVRLLKKETVSLMLKPEMGRQGLIWYETAFEVCGDRLMEHDGYLPGVRTFCDFNPMNRIGLLYFTNGDYAQPFAAYEIMEALYSRGLELGGGL
jgi:CubicO group peptidase (beta-lactamase class C family)